MTALSTPRTIVERDGRSSVLGIKAGVAVLQTALLMQVGGFLRPARVGQGATTTDKANDAATCRVVGVASETVTGGATDGEVSTTVRAGIYNFVNSAGIDALTDADVGSVCFVVDDQTVARTSAGGIRPPVGLIDDVDAEGVWVKVGPTSTPTRRTIQLPFAINETDTLAGTSAELVSPVAGSIIGMSVIVQKAVTTGGDVTALVGVTAVAGLTCTIADAAPKGTIVADTPTLGDATTVVAVGSRIQVAPAAAFNTAGAVSGFVEIAL
ncbi:MAG: hypothetical protein JWP35_3536 [Caulobacter sp.]|nr:hypothetical protein [Caulobacter sp.]